MAEKDLNELFLDTLKDIYYAEKHILKALPRMAKAANSDLLGGLTMSIQKADLGAMPQNDGKALRINLPAMTEERRKELIKTVKRIGEEFRVGVRGERHAALESIKSAEKGKTLSEDQARGMEAKLQKLTDLYVSKVDQEVAAKEKEVSTI